MQGKSQERRANALLAARIERNDRMQRDVESAIADIIQDNQVLSFYRVAERAHIARSTLYRKPELRNLVEQAREYQVDIAKQTAASRVDLVEENEILRHEVERLTRKLKILSSANGRAIFGGIFEYAVIDFALAA